MMIKKSLTFLLTGLLLFSQVQFGFCATELDYMEYSSDGTAQAAYVTNTQSFISNADIDDEDMADITDWADDDSGTGVSSQATFDSKSCLKLDSGATTPSWAQRSQNIGIFGTRTVFSINVYCDTIGVIDSAQEFAFSAFDGTTNFLLYFATDGLFVRDNAAWDEIGTNLVVPDTWQEWTFDVNWTAKTFDAYLDKVLKASGASCVLNSATANGQVNITQWGYSVANGLSYVDWFKAGSDFLAGGALQSYSEATIKTQGDYSLKGEAAITDSLNKTLTRTVSPTIDLTGQTSWVFYIYAGRTGSNIKVGIRDSGLTVTETTPNVTDAGAWQKVTVDISAVADADKNAIDRIIGTIVEATAANTFYLDNMYGEAARRRIMMIE